MGDEKRHNENGQFQKWIEDYEVCRFLFKLK